MPGTGAVVGPVSLGIRLAFVSVVAGVPALDGKNAMVCHITEGELQIDQDGKPFTAKKNFVWTCNKNTKEQASNTSNAVAIMRITDLMA